MSFAKVNRSREHFVGKFQVQSGTILISDFENPNRSQMNNDSELIIHNALHGTWNCYVRMLEHHIPSSIHAVHSDFDVPNLENHFADKRWYKDSINITNHKFGIADLSIECRDNGKYSCTIYNDQFGNVIFIKIILIKVGQLDEENNSSAAVTNNQSIVKKIEQANAQREQILKIETTKIEQANAEREKILKIEAAKIEQAIIQQTKLLKIQQEKAENERAKITKITQAAIKAQINEQTKIQQEKDQAEKEKLAQIERETAEANRERNNVIEARIKQECDKERECDKNLKKEREKARHQQKKHKNIKH